MSSQFNWQDFYKLALQILNQKTGNLEEAKNRTICSRSYYAIFKEVEDFLRDKGKLPKKSNHEELFRFLQTYSYTKDVNTFYLKLRKLGSKRLQADYKRHMKIKERDAKRALRLCEECINLWNTKVKNFLSLF